MELCKGGSTLDAWTAALVGSIASVPYSHGGRVNGESRREAGGCASRPDGRRVRDSRP